jgi:hypothetical protein
MEKLRELYKVELIKKEIAKELIINNHYSKKWSSCRYAFGLFQENNLIGVAVYGFPVGRQVVKSITNDLENNQVLELTRLWVEDGTPKNTESYFIGRTFDWLRKNTQIKVLISYSDPMWGHLGVIYQATNWLYQGNNTMLIKSHLHKIKGEILHQRSAVSLYGTIKRDELLKIDPDYQRIEIMKKHRYIYILNRVDKKTILGKLKHPILPYPKDNLNCNW